jgi:tellurite resistance protein TerC
MKRSLVTSYKVARRIAIFVIGVTVMLVGVIMIVTPGPAFVVVPLGLAILAVEFAWARVWLKKLRAAISSYTSNNRADKAQAHRNRASDRI